MDTEETTRRAPGRPRLPDAERRRSYAVWLNDVEYETIMRNAEEADMDMPAFIRYRALLPEQAIKKSYRE